MGLGMFGDRVEVKSLGFRLGFENWVSGDRCWESWVVKETKRKIKKTTIIKNERDPNNEMSPKGKHEIESNKTKQNKIK